MPIFIQESLRGVTCPACSYNNSRVGATAHIRQGRSSSPFRANATVELGGKHRRPLRSQPSRLGCITISHAYLPT
ncbi:hypothetical protein CC2G_009785 [Coprinopsis cinerea AmutBmut pab1-1]|nr:hypothetical protein CC2G_009785 [Coprinopsis cinerea AmutBmut pab1-1]